MHFSYVEIGDNFQPDIVTDQFRRVPVKFGMALNEGDDMSEAITTIKQAIKEYIEKNTVYHSPQFISESLPPEPAVLPSIQVEKEESKSLEDQIQGCKTRLELNEYKLIVSMNQKLNKIFWEKDSELIVWEVEHPQEAQAAYLEYHKKK